jgi:hypothetical protein
MKNVVECYKEFFGYFNALETNGAMFPRYYTSGKIQKRKNGKRKK